MIARLYGKPSGSPRRAMTLVEVLAVVVILGLLAGTLAVGFSGAFGKGKHELAKTGIAQVVGRLELLKMDRGTFPASPPSPTASPSRPIRTTSPPSASSTPGAATTSTSRPAPAAIHTRSSRTEATAAPAATARTPTSPRSA